MNDTITLGDEPLPKIVRPDPILIELTVETQCHDKVKRTCIGTTIVNQLLYALFSRGQMTAFQIKQMLESITSYWSRVDRKDEELPMIEWESESDEIFVCSSCRAMMFIQFLDDEDTKPQFCPRCRGVNTLVPAEPDNELCRPVLKLIPGGVGGDRGGKNG